MSDDRIARLLLTHELTQFLYAEAELLDERRYDEWLDLLSEDLRYWMPMRRNVRYDDTTREFTREGEDISWFDEGKDTLARRVRQIQTGIHWAEEPLSRVSHLVSNIRLAGPVSQVPDGSSVRVKCHFLVHRNRLETETDFIAGRREDTLRRVGGSFRISSRKIIIDQSVLLAKNLTFFF